MIDSAVKTPEDENTFQDAGYLAQTSAFSKHFLFLFIYSSFPLFPGVDETPMRPSWKGSHASLRGAILPGRGRGQ
jgi:hypothetical protein